VVTREQLERIESDTLAPFAFKASASKGRVHREDEHPYRTAFQRDRDRIIHSSAFRRLEYKTQVFINFEGDYYRTRLTHTMEVAQIARSVARALGLNQDLTEAIALAHDLGHPPFGHSGERVLDELMRRDGGFEHNQQSYRVVTVLEDKYPGFQGLNLTHEVLEGLDKHHSIGRRGGKRPTRQHTLEAQVVDLSDEIAYISHDVDDGLTAGLLDPNRLVDVPLWRKIFARVRQRGPDLPPDKLKYQSVRLIIDHLVSDLLAETESRLRVRKVRSVEDVRSCREPLAAFSPTVMREKQALRQHLFDHMYRHYRVQRVEAKTRKVLKTLFDLYEQNPRLFPSGGRERVVGRGESPRRAIADYIAGMTDRFAIEEYAKLTDPSVRV
jgi:dGTPase